MADRPLSANLPADLPEDWASGEIVAPNGADVSLSTQHGYNYLMNAVNSTQEAVNTINESFDGISTGGGIAYGVCSTAANVADKAVTVDDDDFQLVAGASVRILFTNACGTDNPTLNVNNTGAVAIRIGSHGQTDYAVVAGAWSLGNVIDFVYDGANWRPVSLSYLGNTSFQAGYYSRANAGTTSVAIGFVANANGGVAIGTQVTSNSYGVALGANNTGTIRDGISIGTNIVAASQQNTINIGCNITNNVAANTIAIGSTIGSVGTRSIAFGRNVNVLSSSCIGIGNYVQVDKNYDWGIVIGNNAFAKNFEAAGQGQNCIIIGTNAGALYNSAVSTGCADSIVLGRDARSYGSGGICVGYGSNAHISDGIAIGGGAFVESSAGVAIGRYATAQSAIGGAISVGFCSMAVGGNAVSIGNYAHTTISNAIAIGGQANVQTMHSIAIGQNANTRIGTGTSASQIAIGYLSNTNATGAVALGATAEVHNSYSTSIGFNAKTSNANSIQLGEAANLSSITAKVTSITANSDARDKTDITDIADGATEFLKKIRAIRYVYNGRLLYQTPEEWTEEEVDTGEVDEDGKPITETVQTCNLSEEERENRAKFGLGSYDREAHAAGALKGSRVRAGVLAQEVLAASADVYGDDSYFNIVNDNLHDFDPEEIPEGVENQLGVSYSNFIPVIIKSIQEIDARLTRLEEAVTANA